MTNANGVPSSETCSSRATSTNAAAIPVREERVAVEVDVDLGENELVGERQRRCEELAAADDRDALLAGEQLERLVERAGALGAPPRSSRSFV